MAVRSLDFLVFGLDGFAEFRDVFFAKFDFEFLVFDFLGKEVELAVVAHVVDFHLVVLDDGLGVVDFFVFENEVLLEFLDFSREVFDTVLQTGHLVFEVLHLEGEFATDCLDTVDFGEYCLQLVEGFKTLLDRCYLLVFLVCCHIYGVLCFVFYSVRWCARGSRRRPLSRPHRGSGCVLPRQRLLSPGLRCGSGRHRRGISRRHCRQNRDSGCRP